MKAIFQKPHVTFWWSVPIVVSFGFIEADVLHQLSMGGKNFSIAQINLVQLVALLFEILGFAYWLLLMRNFQFNRWLTNTHILTSLALSVGIWLVGVNIFHLNSFLQSIGITMDLCVKAFIVVQSLFVVNIMIALFKVVRTQKTYPSM